MLRTKRLILRCGQADDLDDMFAIYSNVDAMRYWSTLPHCTPNETAQKPDRIAQQPADAIRYFMTEMQERVVGTAGLHKVDHHPDQRGPAHLKGHAYAQRCHAAYDFRYHQLCKGPAR